MGKALILATKRIKRRGHERRLACLDGDGLHPVQAGDAVMIGQGRGEARLLTEDYLVVAEVTSLRPGVTLEQLIGMTAVKR